MTVNALEMTTISRHYGPVIANDRVSLAVAEGEIHALVGENGAGKSTLLSIAAGLERPDSGEVRLFGEHLPALTPRRAIQRGVGMVQQHFLLVPSFTVAENVVLGAEPSRAGVFKKRAAEDQVAALSAAYGLRVDPCALVSDLSVGEQQRVELLKVLYRKAKLILLDEPTAVLAPLEVKALFEVLSALREAGHTLVFVTHKLQEVMSLSSRVTVMRQGRVVAEHRIGDVTLEALAAAMVGSEREAAFALSGGTLPTARNQTYSSPISSSSTSSDAKRGTSSTKENVAHAPSALRLSAVSVTDAEGVERVTRVNLEVASGTVVGIAGVQGNGQRELLQAIAGLAPYSGQMFMGGLPLEALSAGERLKEGLAHIPEDRLRQALLPEFTVAENLLLGHTHRFSKGGRLTLAALNDFARATLKAYDVRPPDPSAKAGALSGGNQQKVVVARALSSPAKVLLAGQPTRGVDLLAAARLREALVQARGLGAAILLVSADLNELMALSDFIAVMYHGRLSGPYPRAHVTLEMLGALMAGKETARAD